MAEPDAPPLPSGSAATAGEAPPELVLTTSSLPRAVPSALYTCARMSCCRKEMSFSQVTTKPPSLNAVIDGYHWSPAVVVLTRNSPPDAVPSALKTCPRTACPDVSPPPTL